MLSDEHCLIRDMARQFAQNNLQPFAAQWDAMGTYPHAAIKKMGELGFMGMVVPEAYGGAGSDHLAFVCAVEEIAAGDGGCSTIMCVNNSVVCQPILHYGTSQQKKDFLTPLACGEQLGAFCLTEPQAGSDAAHLLTTAKRCGDNYELNGTKQFITSGKYADIALVFAVTDAQAGKKGISAFIVPTQTPGYEVARLEKKMGQCASDTAQVVFNHLTIPASYRLGGEGEGYKIALSNLAGGRLGIAAQAIGMARAAFAATLSYVQEREAFGQPLHQHQGVAFRLADMATQIEAARALVWQVAAKRDAGEACAQEAAMAKLFASEMAERVCSAALQSHGGYGYLRDFPLERIYRDVRVTQIYEGTSDILRMVISRGLMKNHD